MPLKMSAVVERLSTGHYVPYTEFQTIATNGRKEKGLFDLDLSGNPFTLKGRAWLESGWKRLLDLAITGAISPIVVTGVFLSRKVMAAENPEMPTIIAQTRFGKNNETFSMFKLRSQVNRTEGTGLTDPTFWGKFFRKLSIDELPQIINVVRGEMAIIGRRPVISWDFRKNADYMHIHWPYKVAQQWIGFTDEDWEKMCEPQREEIRHFTDSIRPFGDKLMRVQTKHNFGRAGLTGLHQVAGRRHLDPEQRISADLVYETQACLALDLAICATTALVVVSRRGAR